MNIYEQLEADASKDGVDIIHYKFKSDRIKGLYCNGAIAINSNLSTTAQKACVLAEELGHHYTSVGNIIDMSDEQSRKQEKQARLHGYNKVIGLTGIISAYKAHCRNRYEAAEYLGVTEEYLQECIDCYRAKYGVAKEIDNYVVYFIPTLAVMELI